MDIQIIIKDLREVMNFEFEQRALIFKKYERILQSEIKTNKNNINALSLLAMIKFELRKSTSTSIKCLEKAYREQIESLNDEEFSLLVTNMAYFYIQEYTDKEEIAKKLLKTSIEHNSPYAETYYSMAMIYCKTSEFEKALPLFIKAYEIKPLFRYKYNYAICLYESGEISKSIEILKELSTEFETHEYKAKAYYSLGVMHAMAGEIEEATNIAFDLLKIDYQSLDIDEDLLADLMYLVDEFRYVIKLYDNINMWETADWLGMYFYSLKSLNHLDKALEKLNDVTINLRNQIYECKIEDFDGNKKEWQEYVDSEQVRLDSIKSVYYDVFKNNIKPKCNAKTFLLYGCYYIDCPRHSLDNIQELRV